MADNFETFTIRGLLKFPKFITPESYDSATGKFVEDWEKGEFGTYLELPEGEAYTKEWELRLHKIQEAHLEELKKSKKYSEKFDYIPNNFPVLNGTDKDKNPNGKKDFKFKRAVKNKKGDVAEIKYWSAARKPIEYDELKTISSGSDARINFMVYGWDKQTKDPRTKEEFIEYGISLCLLQVQVIKAVKNSQECAFDDEFDNLEETTEDVFGELAEAGVN